MPGRATVSDLVTDEQELSVGKSARPDPAQTSLKAGRVRGGQAHMLFQKPEHVLDGKAPQVHPSQVRQGYRSGSGPEEIERPLETRGTVGFEKLDREHHANQEGQLIEVEVGPCQ